MAHICKRGPRRWEVSVHLGGGKRRWLSVRGTRRQAERAAACLEDDVQSGALVEPTAATVGDYLEQWLETHVCLQNAPRTYQDYRYHAQRFLQPRLGHLKLTQLRPLHLQSLYVELRQQGHTRTADYVHQVVRKALNDAVRLQLLARNPALAARPLRSRAQPVDIPSVEVVPGRRWLQSAAPMSSCPSAWQ